MWRGPPGGGHSWRLPRRPNTGDGGEEVQASAQRRRAQLVAVRQGVILAPQRESRSDTPVSWSAIFATLRYKRSVSHSHPPRPTPWPAIEGRRRLLPAPC
ncbi:Os05g0168002 [Oryza sativa Japonica Group]|uniref:Os05g0168002 protein n=1 Tax=Oryza sativa subsp. japonica TaxID=39947 RepID=A0A0P0WIT1_ORYSJ|nr:Os05g0168002 [Oryza sativa Japonica Group]